MGCIIIGHINVILFTTFSPTTRTPSKMEINTKILSDVTVFTKYARYNQELERRENWIDLCNRNMNMHIEKYPQLEEEIRAAYRDFVVPKKVLPSMRSLQFAGKPIELSPNRIYNCCFTPVDHVLSFSEIMFLLLGGSGVGYSVQRKHVDKLPEIHKSDKKRRYVAADSIEGWADCVRVLMRSYFQGKPAPVYDFSDIRPKGAPLVTSGGKAPGPEPLKDCIHNIRKILDRKENGDKLTTLEVHDIICYIADAVLAGGIRRAALICLFDIDDEDMLTSKFGNWWELNPQRGRANNSAVVIRHKVTEEKFKNLWGKVKASGSGEPGIYFSNNEDWGTNPCVEIALRPNQFCNLTEINGSIITTQAELNAAADTATFLGTLQAGYTDFHYLRDVWKKTTEREALLGVSITGIASTPLLKLNFKEASARTKVENKRVAEIIGIKPASRITCVKPAGTTSLVLGTSSGIHAWHDKFYIRRMRLGKNEAIYQYLKKTLPMLVEDEFFNPTKQAVLSIPIKAPKGAIDRNEDVEDLLERVKKISSEWVAGGHIKGDNGHNVSATINIKDNDWDRVGKWMWENRDSYNGLSCLPFDNANYKQMPFETITEEQYNELSQHLKNINLDEVEELTDETDLKGEIACAGGACTI